MMEHKIEETLKSFHVVRNPALEKDVKQSKGLDIHVYEMSWLGYEKCLDELKKQLTHVAFVPQVIVVVMRGAERVALDASKFFPGVKIARVWIKRTVEDGVAAKKAPPKLYKQDDHLAELIMGKRVLIVDDVVKYGDTMMLAKETIERLHPSIVKTGTLLTARECQNIDFPGAPIYQRTWMVFPWDL